MRSQFDDVSLGELYRRRSYKWRAFSSEVLPAFVAEMDFPLAPVVARAISEAVAEGDTGYAWHDQELGEALSGFLGRRFGWDVDPADILLVPDVMTGVTELLRRVLDPGADVVINTPVYPPFFSRIAEAGCRVVEVPLIDASGSYQLDLEGIEHAFASGARAYLLCNPHNPTGRVFSRTELERIAELAERYDVLVLSDEIHAPLALPGAHHIPFLSLGEPATSHSVALVSASKGWNIPGLKCAQMVVASDRMRSLVECLPPDMVFRTGNIGIIASTAAYRDGDAWLDELINRLDCNRQLMRRLLAEHLPRVQYVPAEATYLAWLDCRGLGLPEEPADVFLARGQVALGNGSHFGTAGAGHVRVTLATSPEILREIVERMRVALA